MTSLRVRLTEGDPINIEVLPGEALYVLGANGSGKSTLLVEWAKRVTDAPFVSGNRQVLFSSAAVRFSPETMIQAMQSAQNNIRAGASRASRTPVNDESFLDTLLARLKEKGDHCHREYVRLDQAGETAAKNQMWASLPERRVNAALDACSLPIALRWNERSELTVEKRGVETPYGIDKMSDGERSALILAMSSILASDGKPIFIDEPERHLHRSISSPLLEFLRRDRPDLMWIIATHDISLVRSDPTASILLLYDFDGSAWRAELPPEPSELSPEIADAIYGAREKVLFVEGRETSLDKPLYNLFFPGVSIVGAGSSRQVIQAVRGLRITPNIHHMKPAGLIDADNRNDLAALRAEGIQALGAYAIESVYYQSAVMAAVLEAIGGQISTEQVIDAACKSLQDADLQRFAVDASYKSFRHAFAENMPSIENFENFDGNMPVVPARDFQTPPVLLEELKQMRDERRWDELVARVKLKSSPAPGEVARKLGLKNSGAYELAARKRLAEQTGLVAALRNIVPQVFEKSRNINLQEAPWYTEISLFYRTNAMSLLPLARSKQTAGQPFDQCRA